MKLIPYEKYSFKCDLSAEQASLKLKGYTEPRNILRLGGGSEIFQGTVDTYNFKISRIIGYRNSFLPQIKGKMIPDGDNVEVTVKMSLHPFIIAFMFIWFSGVIAACTASTVAFFNRINFENPVQFGLLMPYGMLLFGVGLCTIPFWLEVKKAKYELNRIFGTYMI